KPPSECGTRSWSCLLTQGDSMSEMMKKRLFLRTALKSTLAKSKPSFELQVLNNDNNGHLRIPLSEDQLLRLLFGGGQTVEVECDQWDGGLTTDNHAGDVQHL